MEAESPIPISKRTKSLISHITQGLKERNEVMSLAFLSCIEIGRASCRERV